MQVRHGCYDGEDAIYKVWDLGDDIQPVLELRQELVAYTSMQSIQVLPRGLNGAMQGVGPNWNPGCCCKACAAILHAPA